KYGGQAKRGDEKAHMVWRCKPRTGAMHNALPPGREEMQERSQPEVYALQQRLQAAESPREVALCAVDESAAALAYEQAVLWWLQPAARRLAMVGSGLAEISADSPYQDWLARLVDAITPQPFDRPGTFTLADLSETVAADGVEWFPGVLLHCPLCRPDGI